MKLTRLPVMRRIFVQAAMLVCCIVLFTASSFAQDSSREIKSLPATRLEGSIKIDGNVNEAAWSRAAVATEFTELQPNAGRREFFENRTEIRILYDDFSIYVAGYCHEKSVDSVQKELVGRDRIGSNDFVGIIFDTYNDKINGSGFFVTPLGEQFDAKYSSANGEDESWDAVWFSESKLQKDGWSFEIRIPYSALRFSENGEIWGLNILRRRNKFGQELFWNKVDQTVNGLLNQSGLWTGIKDIKPPFRLSLSPYFSAYANHYPYNVAGSPNGTQSVNGGMDLKYGINQNYTLDMTLIPDFGQVQSDRRVLNLSPFEVQYNENRPFFTEGLELFNKGDLFYSRRVGGEPLNKYVVEGKIRSGETIIDNPNETSLINGTKISGRGQSGLGLGFFNAMTKQMYATVEQDSSKQQYKLLTNPFTNYNIIVADQTLKNNSSVSLINTSVIRDGKDYDATVTAFVFDLFNKTNNYNLEGKTAVSNLWFPDKNITGYAHDLEFSKNNGRFNYSAGQSLADRNFDNNDLGILFNNDFIEHEAYLGYKWIKPTKYFNNLFLNLPMGLSHRLSDGGFQGAEINFGANSQLKNLSRVGGRFFVEKGGRDFYEPRKNGRYFQSGNERGWSVFYQLNSAKKYFSDYAIRRSTNSLLEGIETYFGSEQRYRFNDKFSLSVNLTLNTNINDIGYAGNDTTVNTIVFSKRKRITAVNDLNAKYSFSNKMGINVAVRHYWSQVKVNQFYDLQNDGTLNPNTSYLENKDFNVNLFNIDMQYTYQVAQGSFINIVWKNAISSFGKSTQNGYFKNFGNTFSEPQNNNISLKILYFLDYIEVKKKLKKT